MTEATSAATQPVELLLIGGSLRAGSSHAAALRTAQALVPSGASARLFERLGDLPPSAALGSPEPPPP